MKRSLVAGALALMLAVPPAMADGPAPFPEFSAKRVTPPKKGAKKRITIQIEPQEVAVRPPEVSVDAKPDAPAPATRYDWFWETISPELAEKGPGRLEPALLRLSNPPTGKGVSAPRLHQLQGIVSAQGREILKATVGTGVSPALVLAVIAVESGGRSDAVSHAGARGLMQLMPDTATRFGVADSLVAADNIAGGVKYLDWLMTKFDRDPILALAGYNAGENAVTRHGGVPPYAETRDYVPKVLAAYAMARDMCITRPELLSDGCVFRFQ